jgi:hypothetical protein
MARGSCLCGDVAFELTEPLTEIELCQCRKCRKAYGAPLVATLYGRREAFRWLRGETRVARFDAPLEESPPAYRHSFCPRCGSPLPLLWDDLPFVEVPAAALDDPVAARPVYQMFECQRPAWADGIPAPRRYERASPLAEKVLQPLLRRRAR